MRRPVGLQSELIVTTALLVGAALVLGGFLLLRLAERKLVEQQLSQVRSTVQLVGRALTMNPDVTPVDTGQVATLLEGVELDVDAWVLYDRSLLPLDRSTTSASLTDDLLLARQASLGGGVQLQLDYPGNWLPFADQKPGSIAAAIALHDVQRRFSGVVWMQFSLADVQRQIVADRKLVLLYVCLYGLILTAFGVVVLSRNVVRPVNRLREATAGVAAGNLESRVTTGGPRELAELGESFNRMTEALRTGRDELLRLERMASVGHLSAGMAHEIGNPLAAIIGYLELLKADIKDPAQRDLVCRSLDEATRIDRLVRELLDYAAPTEVDAEPIDPQALVAEIVTALQGQVAFDGYTINMTASEALPGVCINPHKLTQVLINLISNARDASPQGSSIAVAARQEGDQIVISVRDQGEGISDAVRKQIFDPFFSTKPEGEGRGLGLTICHQIVEAAGGRIEVVSETNLGTMFFVHLPICDGMR